MQASLLKDEAESMLQIQLFLSPPSACTTKTDGYTRQSSSVASPDDGQHKNSCGAFREADDDHVLFT